MSELQKTSDIKTAIRNTRFQKDRYWRLLETTKSHLLSALASLTGKSEHDLTKTDLLALISLNFDYMRALNLYNYFKAELTNLLVKEKEEPIEIVE